MTAGTTQLSGRMAGASRPGTCPAHAIRNQIAAPMHNQTWLGVATGKPVSQVFLTDRPARRLSERFP
jgi:hypothetical protein